MIRLRPLEPDDVALMDAVENDASQWTLAGAYAPVSREMLTQYALTYDADPLRAGQMRMVVSHDGESVGLLDIYEIDVIHQRAFVGIYILPEMRRKGCAHAALARMEQYCRDVLGLHQLVARVERENAASMALFGRAGYVPSAVLTDWYRRGRAFVDVVIFQRVLD